MNEKFIERLKSPRSGNTLLCREAAWRIESQQRKIEELREEVLDLKAVDEIRCMSIKSLKSRLDRYNEVISAAANFSSVYLPKRYVTGWKDCVAWIQQSLTQEGE